MKSPGPKIERLTRRLAETPGDFLESPVPEQGKARVNTAAVVSDLLVDLGGSPLDPVHVKRLTRGTEARELTTILIASWLLHDDWFVEGGRFSAGAEKLLLGEDVRELSHLVEPTLFVTDPDRREELARICLDRLGLVPEDESETTARDRLTTLSTVERQRVILESKKAQERMRRIQEEMKRKAAREAAPAWGRE